MMDVGELLVLSILFSLRCNLQNGAAPLLWSSEVGYQDSSDTAILQISVEVSDSSRNRFTAWLSYVTLGYTTTCLYILP